MALTDYIGIRGADGDEPFQGLAGGSLTVSGLTIDGIVTTQPDTQPDTTTPTNTTPTTQPADDASRDEVADILRRAFLIGDDGQESIIAKAWLTADGASLFEKAWLYQDGDALVSILRKAWLYQDAGDPAYKSILKKALLYVQNPEGQNILESVLHDMLKDLAFVDAVLDFGFMRVHIKGKTIEYSK